MRPAASLDETIQSLEQSLARQDELEQVGGTGLKRFSG